MQPNDNKPQYRVPSMQEIAAMPWNGYKVASTFSGCGGSCLGYRMAGFRVAWANEFVPSAQESYRANAAEDSVLDCRDINLVKPQEILDATELKVGELDLFDGSPPCQAFSTAGKREKGWGHAKTYEHGAKQCNETLFDQYIRILDGLKPKVFVAENVSGLVKGVAKGYFLEILAKLKACGYRVGVKVLDAQWLGVPQARQRTIFIGVRDDIGKDPVFPKPLPYRYTVRDALPWIVRGKYGPTWKPADAPSPTVSAQRSYNPVTSHQGLELVEAVVQDTNGQFPSDGNVTERPSPAIMVEGLDMSRFAIGKEWDRLKPGESSERYFNLVRPHPDAPCPTICASHGHPGIASVTHPTEKRKLAIAELKRICAFPDDFVLTGTYAQQWERLGNSVPPVMMRCIAEIIRDKILE